MASKTSRETSIAVIGAGLCGLTCAKHLKANGYSPTVLEKSRGVGGRMATRRAENGVAFDHGAQYITVRNADFKDVVDEAIADGSASYWLPSRSGGRSSITRNWIVGLPGMSGFVRSLANEIDIRLSTEVTGIDRMSNTWRVRTHENPNGENFDCVVVTAPAPQARTLLVSEPDLASVLGSVSIDPCLAMMVAFEEPLKVDFDAQRWDSGDLAWIARNSAKPERDSRKDCWVIHASPSWSALHLELERDEIAQKLLCLLNSTLGVGPPPIFHMSGHKWRFALTTLPLGKPFLASEDNSLFVGGDWCLGARVEYAFESGQAIAKAIAASLKN